MNKTSQAHPLRTGSVAAHPPVAVDPENQARFRGCLLGGPVGDALGAPVEFMGLPEIRARFGAAGIRDFVPYVGKAGAITGDSDSTGAIAGNLLGALHGVDAIPRRWLEPLELRGVIEEIADDLLSWPQWPVRDKLPDDPAELAAAAYWIDRYPGG